MISVFITLMICKKYVDFKTNNNPLNQSITQSINQSIDQSKRIIKSIDQSNFASTPNANTFQKWALLIQTWCLGPANGKNFCILFQ